MYSSVQDFMAMIENKNPNEVEFHQAVREVVDSLWDFLIIRPPAPEPGFPPRNQNFDLFLIFFYQICGF